MTTLSLSNSLVTGTKVSAPPTRQYVTAPYYEQVQAQYIFLGL